MDVDWGGNDFFFFCISSVGPLGAVTEDFGKKNNKKKRVCLKRMKEEEGVGQWDMEDRFIVQ